MRDISKEIVKPLAGDKKVVLARVEEPVGAAIKQTRSRIRRAVCNG